MRIILGIVMLLVVSSYPVLAGVDLPFGEGEGKVSFFNAHNHPDCQEPVPLGPLSFRYAAGEFWLADSVAGRVLHLAADGKILGMFPVTTADDLVEDLGLRFGADGKVKSLFVLCSKEQEIREFSPDGKKIRTLGGRGEAPGQFVQMHRIEIGPSGRLYVADKGRQMITVFSPAGKVEREVHWEWSGLCLDPKENLCRLKWDEAAQVSRLIVETPDGKVVRETALQLGAHTDPELWLANEKDEVLLTFTPPEGFKGTFKMAVVGVDGKPSLLKDLKPPIAMNRFLDRNGREGLFLGVADYHDAPAGTFKIEPFSLE